MYIYKNIRKYSESLFTFLFAVLFLLISVANRFNFGGFSTKISDAALSSSPVYEIEEKSLAELPDLKNLAENYLKKNEIKVLTSSSYISIAGKAIQTFKSNNTKTDAGSRVAKYNDHFYYGHNSSSVFGSLASLPIGSTFSITENGLTKNYQIVSSETFNKINENTLATTKNPNRNFSNAIYSASYLGEKYDIALMTCAGQPIGQNDATERYVVFANEV